MKKTYYFLLSILAIAICACTMPKEIEVKGTVSNIKFEANMDFGKEFKNMVIDSFSGDGNDGLITQYCINDEITTQTYLVKMDAIKDEFTIVAAGGSTNLIINDEPVGATESGGIYTLTNEATVFKSGDNGKDSITLSLSKFGESLKGFTFNSELIEAKIYITSEEAIIEAAKISLTFVNVNTLEETLTDSFIISNRSVSNIDSSLEYDRENLPPDGHLIEDFGILINEKSDFRLDIEVLLPINTAISNTLFGDPINISAELVIWLPMDLKAEDDNAKISFSGIFDGVGSFINDISGYMEELSLIVEMDQNPFHEGKLVMSQGQEPQMLYYIEHLMSANTLSFKIEEDDMRTIERLKKGFDPEIGIVYKKGDSLEIPKNFRTSHVSLNAKISYMIMGDK